jgi:undecaprenyl-diphosphatase
VSAGRERFLARPARAFWTGIALLAIVALVALVIPTGPLGVDQRWSEAMLDSRTAFLTNVALVFNWLGRGIGETLTLAAVGVTLLVRRRWSALIAFALAEALALSCSSLLKLLVGRPRPPDGLVHPVGSSFPSGHATYGAVTCVALVLLFSVPGPSRLWWWGLAGLGTLGMAWSRTYLQVHWLSDVVAGSCLGVGMAFVAFGGAQAHLAGVTRRGTTRAPAPALPGS